ncbi:MAG: DUF1800 domain-containing protein [Candidatus Obscuribacterales bacterium]|nr:DUF1800 domain-containing protein [Candidatus Obscuribacterales bacterium]
MRKYISVFVVLLLLSAPTVLDPVTARENPSPAGRDKILHLLNRVTFGPSPADITTVEHLGIEGFIDQQLHPETISLPPFLEKVASKETVSGSPAQLYLDYGPPAITQFKNQGTLKGSFGEPNFAPRNGSTPGFRRARGGLSGQGVQGQGRLRRGDDDLSGGFGAQGGLGELSAADDSSGGFDRKGNPEQRRFAGNGQFLRARGRVDGFDLQRRISPPSPSNRELSDSGSEMEMNSAAEMNGAENASEMNGEKNAAELNSAAAGPGARRGDGGTARSAPNAAGKINGAGNDGATQFRRARQVNQGNAVDAGQERQVPDGQGIKNRESGKANGKDPGQKILGQIHRKFYGDISTARLTRSIYSPRQLEELMVDFWFNHFNVSFDKGLDHIWVGTYEEHAIRPHVFGKFRDLLGATAHHAAMSFYLDNWQNTAPESPGARGKLQGLNENYARELLELHTLGVDGGYSQKDVVELARVLTGVGFQRRERYLRSAGMMQSLSGTGFDSSRHDFKEKVLLKKNIRGTGESELEEALDLLAKHPSTAKHIATKLAVYFVADNPPPSLVRKLADKFTTTGGDIRALMNELLHSEEFWDGTNFNCKFKSPYKYMVSTLRGSDAKVIGMAPLVNFLNQSGMPLYKCLTPDGYKCTRSAWLSPDALIKRINLATNLGVGRFPGAEPGYYDYQRAMSLLGPKVSSRTLSAIESAPQPLRLALILGSPEFMMY